MCEAYQNLNPDPPDSDSRMLTTNVLRFYMGD